MTLRSFILLIILILFTSACSTTRVGYQVDTSQRAVSFDSRVQVLVLHYTAGDDTDSLQLLTQGDVSAHYLIAENPPQRDGEPVIRGLVDEAQRAWHAGESQWGARGNLNEGSIGIEIVNLGYVDGPDGRRWLPFTQTQIDALIPLARDIIERYHIAPYNVVAHADIAPQRKLDPGPLFPWQRLA